MRTSEFKHTESEPAFEQEFQEFLCAVVPGPDLIGITILGPPLFVLASTPEKPVVLPVSSLFSTESRGHCNLALSLPSL